MKYRKLGKTAMQVSVVGVGTWQLGGEWGKTFEQAEVDAMLGKAADLGVNLIDTAECYGDHLSEELVGRAIKGQRDKCHPRVQNDRAGGIECQSGGPAVRKRRSPTSLSAVAVQ